MCNDVEDSQLGKPQVSTLSIVNTDHGTTLGRLGDVSWVQKPLYSSHGCTDKSNLVAA